MKPPKQRPGNERYCTVCGESGADRAHIRTRRAGAGWREWEWMYLCRIHHVEQGNDGWPAFCDRHPSAMYALFDRGWTIELVLGVRKVVRS